MSGTSKAGTQPQADKEERLDEMIDESFPASDPPSFTPGGASGDPHIHEGTGVPDSGRHASETAAGRQEQRRPPETKHE
jgi:hypothetical protein